ncbi:MAG: sigma-54 interaction domain-containing protein [Vicinamibacterales bacterium]
MAVEARDTKQEGWARLHAYRLETIEKRLDSAPLAKLRRVATSAGDPHLTVALHETIAVAEGQIGLFTSAKRHLGVARSLLTTYPNAWLSQKIDLTAACIDLLSFDLESADKHLRSGTRLGEITGCEFSAQALIANRTHLHIVSGQMTRAVRSIDARRASAPQNVRIGMTDGIARLALALNDCDTVRSSINGIRALGVRSESYLVRWAGLTLCKLLHRQRNYAELFSTLDAEEATARRLEDHPLLAALHLVRAEALAETGDLAGAGRRLFEAAELGIAGSAELQGQFHLSAGRILAGGGHGASAMLTARALRRWRHQRNVLALLEAESFGKPAMPLADYHDDPRFARKAADELVAVPPEHRPLAVLDAAVTAMDMGGTPVLLGAELRQIAHQLGVSSRVDVVRDRRSDEASDDGAQVVHLGHEANRDVYFRCSPADTPQDNLALASLTRLARSATALERLRSEEKDRAALWPISDQELEGALYIDEQMTSLLATARKVAASNVSVLITGETGTGKEVLARTIHAASPRAKAHMVPFNCTACPKDMVDAQLFGHRRGAFTGAMEAAPGVIRAASGGTLFLDEIGEAPLDVQPKLLRFLESGEVHPIGEPRPTKVDVRVIAATNVDLTEAVREGRFREDLYYRLNIVTLHVPPLRERRSEIPVLAEHYLRQAAMEQRKGRLRLAEETVEYLLLYRWPGNVRQLANEVRRMAALAEVDQVLMPEHLSPELAASRRTVPPSERQLDVNEIAVRIDQPLAAAAEHVERAMVLHALRACNGRVEEAARRLGLSRKGLYLKRVRFGMEIAESAESRTA